MTEKNNTGTLVLEPVQTLRTIEETREILVRHLGTSRNVSVDCSLIEEADISIVQLLLAARTSADRLGIALDLTPPSPALAGVLERTGVPATAIDPAWSGGAP